MPRRPLWRRLLPLVLLAALALAWMAVRPQKGNATLLEYPIAILLVVLLLWDAARDPRPVPVAAPPLRRHEQVVRDVPDPDARALVAALDAYVATGARAPEAADALARATGGDAATILPTLTRATSRRKREALLRQTLGE